MRTLILKLTHRLWNREIARLLCQAHEYRVIDSKQLHILTSWFDPTQRHRVYGRMREHDRALHIKCEEVSDA